MLNQVISSAARHWKRIAMWMNVFHGHILSTNTVVKEKDQYKNRISSVYLCVCVCVCVANLVKRLDKASTAYGM